MLYNAVINLIDTHFQFNRKRIAKAILQAQDIREDSWNDALNNYDVTIYEASEIAGLANGFNETNDDAIINLIASLNSEYWNEIQDWAINIVKTW